MKQLYKYPSSNEKTSYIVPDGVITIKEAAFTLSNVLETLIIPNTVSTLESDCFRTMKTLQTYQSPNVQKKALVLHFNNLLSLKELL